MPAVLGYGENNSLTYLATGSHNLDLFFDAVPGVELEHLESLLCAAWEEDPNIAVRIIFQLGDPRKGKGDLRNYYRSMMWMYRHHYDTFMLNLEHVPTFGFYGALLEMLMYARESGALEADIRRRDAWRMHKRGVYYDEFERREQRKETHKRLIEEFLAQYPEEERLGMRVEVQRVKAWHEGSRWATDAIKGRFEDFVRRLQVEEARALRRRNRAFREEAAKKSLEDDGQYRQFYEQVAGRFAVDLVAEAAEADGGRSIGGLAAKWAPSPGGKHDKQTLIVNGIVEHLYPPEKHLLADGTYEDYLSFMRDKYRRLLSRLRGAAEVPEHFVGSGSWHLVNYSRMASLCRHMHGHIYRMHDRERYVAYLEDARQGKIKGPAAGAVLPHALIRKALDASDSIAAEEAGLQWMSLVRDTKAAGRLPSALAICDTSGSMWSGGVLDVAIALSLLLSDVAEEPWKNKVCTFSKEPHFFTLPPATADNLQARANEMWSSDWGYCTDLAKVFEDILLSAKTFEVPVDAMPEALFIFSDMEFDKACKDPWTTDYEHIQREYGAAGYKVPQIVFWNLRASRSHPTHCQEPGVAMLSGFSAGMLKSFLKEFKIEDITPLNTMLECLRPYSCLRVASADLPPGSGE